MEQATSWHMRCGSNPSDFRVEDVAMLLSLHKPTSVTASCCGRFRNESTDLAIGICNIVDLYSSLDGDASLEHSFNVSARILSLRTLPSPNKPHHFQKRDGLLCITADLQFTLLLWHQGTFVPTLTVTLASSPLGPPMSQLRVDDPPQNLQRCDAPCFAELHTVGRGGQEVRVLAVAIFHRLLHVMVLTWPSKSPVNLVHHRLSRAGLPGVPTTQGLGLLNVQSMAFVLGASPRGPVLATLTTDEAGARNVHFMELSGDYSSFTSDYGLTLWNVHPTTSLMTALPKSYQQGRGVLLVSSVSAMLVRPELNRTERTTRLEMEGEPVCMERIYDLGWAVADTLGGVYILRLGPEDLSATHIQCSRPPCIPTTLSFLLGWGPAQAGILYIGSHGSDPQLLAATQAPGIESPTELSAQWELLPSLCPESFAPIHDAVRFEDPPGSGEGVLLMCCGLAPTGSVCLARMSIALVPSITDGPCLVGQPRLITIAAPGGEHDAYLALSFEAAGYTTLLDVRGTRFQEATVLGLALATSSLLLARTPSGQILQVTPQEVIIADDRHQSQSGQVEDVVRWHGPGAISMAAIEGRFLVVACGSTAYVLELPSGSEQPSSGMREAAVLHYEEQISALTLLKGSVEGSEEPQLWLAVGQWVSNNVLLRRPQDGALLGSFAIRSGQARSLVADRLAGHLFLFIGTSEGAGVDSSGKLVWGTARQVQVGLAGVDLELVPAGGAAPAHIFARAEQSLVLRLDKASCSALPGEDPLTWIEAVRVHGGEGLLSSTAVHTAELPASMAWVTAGGQLTFGSLDHQISLRAQRRTLQETPSRVVHHAQSGCALVLTEDLAGSSWLRLFHATSFRQVAAIQLAGGHLHSAVCLAQLPCSSSFRSQDQVLQRTDSKQFVVLASNAYSCDSSGLEQVEGLLSMLEIVTQAAQEGERSRYELVLHGTCSLESPCFSLIAATDNNSNHAQLLVAGCQDGVRLLRVDVDDILEQGRQAVASAVQQIQAGEPLPSCSASGSGGKVPDAEDGVRNMDIGTGEGSCRQTATTSINLDAGEPGSSGRVTGDPGDSSRDWRWRAAVHLSSSCKVPAQAGGCITCLSAFGDTVVAGELLGSLTTFRVQPHRRPPLLRKSADPHDWGTAWVPAAVALSETTILGAVHPQGILLLGSNRNIEEAAEERLLHGLEQRERAARLRGSESIAEPPSPRDSDTQGGPATIDQPELLPLRTCNKLFDTAQQVTCFCVGRLGPQSVSLRLPDTLEAWSDQESDITHGQVGDGLPTPVVYVSREGGMGILQCLPRALRHVFNHYAGEDSTQERDWSIPPEAVAAVGKMTTAEMVAMAEEQTAYVTDYRRVQRLILQGSKGG